MFAYYCDKIHTVTCVYKIKEPHLTLGRLVIDSNLFIIELDGRKHPDSGAVRIRDTGKKEICSAHGFELIMVENSYAGRYNYIKNILIQYFKSVRAY